MIHPKTELKFINKEIGYGVVATEFIPAATITWVLDQLDREFSPKDLKGLGPVYENIFDTYAYRNNKGNFILCWDNGRFVNHSFNSNCLTTAYDFEIAIRDIQPGEQLTDDYGYLNVSTPFTAVNEGTKRKTVYSDDLVNYYKTWDKKIKKVFNRIVALNQPLKPIISHDIWNKIELICHEKEQIDSILNNYYKE